MSATQKSPFFSVIIPTRDRPDDFLVALKSVQEQDGASFEVVVIVDGSSIKNKERYQALEKTLENDEIKFEYLPHRTRGHGHCFARNQGLDISNGEYICFLDDDDWWTDKHFLKRAEEQISKNNIDFYFANQQAVTSTGEIVEDVWVEALQRSLPQGDPRKTNSIFNVSIPELLKLGNFPHMNAWAVKKSLFVRAGSMDECLRYEPDRDIYMRIIDDANSIWHDTNFVSLHNIPDKKNKSNASTLGSDIERLQFQLRTIDKAICGSKRKDIRTYAIQRKSYILKRLSNQMLAMDNYQAAKNYARQALAVKSNLKWLAYTLYLMIWKPRKR